MNCLDEHEDQEWNGVSRSIQKNIDKIHDYYNDQLDIQLKDTIRFQQEMINQVKAIKKMR